MELQKTFPGGKVIVLPSSLYQTNTTLILGKETVLVCDPNWLPREIDGIVARLQPFIETHEFYYLFTHADYDHIIGYGAMPVGKVITSHAMQQQIQPEEALAKVKEWDGHKYIQRNYAHRFPFADYTIDKDGQALMLGEFTVTGYLTRGHTVDGAMYWIESARTLLLGDYLSPLEFPFIEDSWKEYRETLHKMELLFPQLAWDLVIPGHGPCYQDLTTLMDRIRIDLYYLESLGDLNEVDMWAQHYPYAAFLANEHHNNYRRYRQENKT